MQQANGDSCSVRTSIHDSRQQDERRVHAHFCGGAGRWLTSGSCRRHLPRACGCIAEACSWAASAPGGWGRMILLRSAARRGTQPALAAGCGASADSPPPPRAGRSSTAKAGRRPLELEPTLTGRTIASGAGLRRLVAGARTARPIAHALQLRGAIPKAQAQHRTRRKGWCGRGVSGWPSFRLLPTAAGPRSGAEAKTAGCNRRVARPAGVASATPAPSTQEAVVHMRAGLTFVVCQTPGYCAACYMKTRGSRRGEGNAQVEHGQQGGWRQKRWASITYTRPHTMLVTESEKRQCCRAAEKGAMQETVEALPITNKPRLTGCGCALLAAPPSHQLPVMPPVRASADGWGLSREAAAGGCPGNAPRRLPCWRRDGWAGTMRSRRRPRRCHRHCCPRRQQPACRQAHLRRCRWLAGKQARQRLATSKRGKRTPRCKHAEAPHLSHRCCLHQSRRLCGLRRRCHAASRHYVDPARGGGGGGGDGGGCVQQAKYAGQCLRANWRSTCQELRTYDGGRGSGGARPPGQQLPCRSAGGKTGN